MDIGPQLIFPPEFAFSKLRPDTEVHSIELIIRGGCAAPKNKLNMWQAVLSQLTTVFRFLQYVLCFYAFSVSKSNISSYSCTDDSAMNLQ